MKVEKPGLNRVLSSKQVLTNNFHTNPRKECLRYLYRGFRRYPITITVTVCFIVVIITFTLLTINQLYFTNFLKTCKDSCIPEEFISIHNQYRTEVNSTNIKWSNEIADSAYNWATKLSSNCILKHSDEYDRYVQGENIYWQSGVFGNVVVNSVDAWVDEPLVYGVLNHRTQVLWNSSLLLGCGVARNSCGFVVVCRYSPPGNYFDS